MRPVGFTLGMALLAGLISGCADHPTEPPRTVAPAFNFVNGPSPVGGDQVAVYRFQGYWYWFWTDAPLRAWHTNFPFSAGCGPIDLLEPWDMQDVANFREFLTVHRVAEADVHIIVVDRTQPGPCFGATLVAEGMGQIHQTDNDYFAFDPAFRGDRTNANAYGFSAHGALQRPDGAPVTYNGHWRAVWNPSNSAIAATSMEITLH